jgi:plastocyanin
VKRRAISTKVFVGAVVVLLVAALAEGLYFNVQLSQQPNLSTVVSELISPTTITQTVSSTVTSTQTLVTSGTGTTSFQTVTVTSTTPGYKTGLFFNTTLIIIPKDVAANHSLNFVPAVAKVIIGVNNSVTWINQDPLSQHTVVTTSVPNGAPSVDLILATNQTFTVTFKVPGTYPYYCMWHPGWMKGSIIVEPKPA